MPGGGGGVTRAITAAINSLPIASRAAGWSSFCRARNCRHANARSSSKRDRSSVVAHHASGGGICTGGAVTRHAFLHHDRAGEHVAESLASPAEDACEQRRPPALEREHDAPDQRVPKSHRPAVVPHNAQAHRGLARRPATPHRLKDHVVTDEHEDQDAQPDRRAASPSEPAKIRPTNEHEEKEDDELQDEVDQLREQS